jgi:ABC-type sugar transport system ATPase subunit
MDSIVKLDGIGKLYGRKRVLRDVNLTVWPGDFAVVLGMPTSGKSVLVRLLTGLETPDSGRIFIRGQDVTALPSGKRNLGYVPQSFALYPHFSVFENIAYPLTLAKAPKDKIRAEVHRAAELLKIEQFLDRRPDQLSGGQKQRVAIARGLVKNTDIFILDDPLVGLDFKLRERLIEDLKATQEELNVTFIYTTSEAVEALQLASKLAVLHAGEVVEAGSPAELYHRPKREETMRCVGFPQANFVSANLTAQDGRLEIHTPLFNARVRLSDHLRNEHLATPAPVNVGIRPEHVVIDPAPPAHVVSFEAKVLLREDLGGEEIVYLDAKGMQLTTVLRSDDKGALSINIDEHVVASVHPENIAVYLNRCYIGRACVSDCH